MNAVTPTDGQGGCNALEGRGPYRISRKLDAALTALVGGAPTITDAAEKAGMSREGLSVALRKPHVAAELDRRVREAIKRRGIRALSRLAHLSDAARSEYVQLEAAKDLANRAGWLPPKEPAASDTQLIVNISLGDGPAPVILEGSAS